MIYFLVLCTYTAWFFETVFSKNQIKGIEEKEVTNDSGEKVSKKFVKGGRLCLYPSGTNRLYNKLGSFFDFSNAVEGT